MAFFWKKTICFPCAEIWSLAGDSSDQAPNIMSTGCVLKLIPRARAHRRLSFLLKYQTAGLQHCVRWYFVPKNLYEKVNLFQVHREDTSGWHLVRHTCFWGVGHVSPSLGTKDSLQESTVNIMLPKDTPTKIMITIYCHGRERQQWKNLPWSHDMQWSNWH